MQQPRWLLSLLILGWIGCGPGEAKGACINVQSPETIILTGTLTFHIFGGPPYNGGVTKGDTPEPAYIVKLDETICIEGDDFLDSHTKVDRVQVYTDYETDSAKALFGRLRGLVGTRVRVEGRSAFGAHTGHHHAPLLLPLTAIDRVNDPIEAYGTAMTTVQAFYLALAAGNGDEAVRFIVPEKRDRGPFSRHAITRFYGGLAEPLTLQAVTPVGPGTFRVRYTFVVRPSRQCNGEALVQTARMRNENLIQSIKALNGC